MPVHDGMHIVVAGQAGKDPAPNAVFERAVACGAATSLPE
jgi:hypothetical protein